MKHIILIFSILLIAHSVEARNDILRQRVIDNSSSSVTVQLTKNVKKDDTKYASKVSNYVLFDNGLDSKEILENNPSKIKTTFPSPQGDIEVELLESKIFAPSYLVESSSGEFQTTKSIGKHYWGYVKGVNESYVTVSFFEDEWMALVSSDQDGDMVVKKLSNEDRYISFFNKDLVKKKAMKCGTEEPSNEFNLVNKYLSKNTPNQRRADKCVRMHVECTKALYDDLESYSNTLAFIESLFNNVIAFYALEDIPMSLSYIRIWDTEDDFVKSSSSLLTASFGAYLSGKGTLNGDLAHLLHNRALGGVAGQAGGIGGLCSEFIGNRVAWSSIIEEVEDIPTYSEDVATVAHEIGHNLGSPHTHGCYWNGNNTQIDDCGNVGQNDPEGAACYSRFNTIIPSNGGTMMSYCHLNATGINIAKGMGDQPGDLIRSIFSSVTCLSSCEDEADQCGAIYNFGISSRNDNSVTVEWSNSDAVSYKLSWNKVGESASVPITVISPFEIQNLEESSKYEISLVGVCNSGFEMDPVFLNVETSCDAIFDIPYSETFEGDDWELNTYRLDPCWDSEATDYYNWLVGNTTTFIGLTGPRIDHTSGTGKYMLAESDFGGNNAEAFLYSPIIDISEGQGHFVSFWHFMYGAEVNKLQVQARSEGGSWTNLKTISGQQQESVLESWKQEVLSLSDYSGGNVQVRFIASRGADEESDLAIDDFLVSDSSFIDLSLHSINNPISNCELSNAENVSITIRNSGFAQIQAGETIDLNLILNGGPTISESFTLLENLLPGELLDYSFTTSVDLSNFGVQTVSAQLVFASDLVAANNIRGLEILNKPIISSYTYSEDFESGNGNWLSGGTSSTWEFGTPAKAVIKGASSGDNAWVTGGLGTGLHESYEASYVESPCLDFTYLKDPEIEMDIWWDIELGWDGAVFLASVDGGKTWVKIGKTGDPDNWYNSTLIPDAIITPGGDKDVWTGSEANEGSGGWVTAKHTLDGLGEQPNVLLRLWFESDPFEEHDGIGLDNIVIKGESLLPPCYEITVNATTCNPDDVGTEEESFTAVGNCDSVVTTITTLLPSYDIKNTSYTCDPDEASEEIISLETKAGCDSIITNENIYVPAYGIIVNLTTCVKADTSTEVDSFFTTNAPCDSIITTKTSFSPIAADFTFVEGSNSNVIVFTNESENANSYLWEFGDTETSDADDPEHTYDETGTYTVVLTASSDGCEDDTSSQTIEIVSTGITLNFIDQLAIYPNPNSGSFTLSMVGERNNRDLSLEILDIQGRILTNRTLTFDGSLNENFDMSNFSNGEYLLRIQSQGQQATFKISLLR